MDTHTSSLPATAPDHRPLPGWELWDREFFAWVVGGTLGAFLAGATTEVSGGVVGLMISAVIGGVIGVMAGGLCAKGLHACHLGPRDGPGR